MSISKIRLRGLSDIDLPFVGAQPNDTYVGKGVDGLGPPEIDVRISNALNLGGVYQGRNPLSREITVLVGLNPDYSVVTSASDLRIVLYGLLTPGEEDYVLVEIHRLDGSIWNTKAWVKRMEPSIFTRDPEVQIVLPCLQPYLVGAEVSVPAPGNLDNFTVINAGTAPAGFVYKLVLMSDVTFFSMSQGVNARRIRVEYPFLSGDEITVSTIPGSRYVTIDRAGTTIDISGYRTPESEWLMLRGGANAFQLSVPVYDYVSMTYKPNYWGI